MSDLDRRAIAAQRHQAHDVYLLTLTRGEATKCGTGSGGRWKKMGAARERELRAVSTTLDLTDR